MSEESYRQRQAAFGEQGPRARDQGDADPVEYAYAYRSGHIHFGETVPTGALPIGRIGSSSFGRLRSAEPLSRDLIEARARHSYDGKTMIVPGLPEAADDAAALDAFMEWQRSLYEGFANE